jgi:hypothetical protein
MRMKIKKQVLIMPFHLYFASHCFRLQYNTLHIRAKTLFKAASNHAVPTARTVLLIVVVVAVAAAAGIDDVGVDARQAKNMYEKVGEATETALTVLVEKMNVSGIDKTGLSKKDIGTVCNQNIQSTWKKNFTLEFSRDRKSMSSYCEPTKPTKLGPGAKMFVKV